MNGDMIVFNEGAGPRAAVDFVIDVVDNDDVLKHDALVGVKFCKFLRSVIGRAKVENIFDSRSIHYFLV